MAVTLPLTNRNIHTQPFENAEIDAMLLAYATAAQANVATDPMTAIFAQGVYAFLANRRSLGRELSNSIARIASEVALKDQYGNASVILDNI